MTVQKDSVVRVSDKDGDGKLNGDEVRPLRTSGSRERRPDGRAERESKPQAEVERILEFGTEAEVVELAREVEPRQLRALKRVCRSYLCSGECTAQLARDPRRGKQRGPPSARRRR